MDKVIARPWLSLQCGMIPGVRHAVFAADALAGGDFATLETWPEGSDALPRVLATLREAMSSDDVQVREPGCQDGEGDDACWVIACPLRRAGAVVGAVAVQVGGLDGAQVPVVTQLLQWGSAWPAFLADQEQARREQHGEPALGVAAAVLDTRDPRTATTTAATLLARSFEARRVAIGMHDGRGVRIIALSGRATFDARSDRLRAVQAAMNEACDQDVSLQWPLPGGAGAWVTEAHARLSGAMDGAVLCTVPLRSHGRMTGALLLARPGSQPLGGEEISRIEALAGLLGPAMEARRLADRGALARALDNGSRFAGRLLGRGHLRLKLTTLVAAGLFAVLALGTGDYQVSAAAELQGSLERELVAPVDGFVVEAHVRAGARVQAGDLLVTLDDQALQLERRRLRSHLDELTNEYNLALGALDRGATRVLQTQLAQADARLALVDSELQRTRVVAPFDGLVVSGDLSQSLGSPVARGDLLFRLAPLDGYRVILQLEEGDVPAVETGVTGQLSLAALPGERFDIVVERVNGMASTADGRNVLEAEAALGNGSEHLRPGMKGVARVHLGRANLWWIWTHRLAERLRLWLWAWSPVV